MNRNDIVEVKPGTEAELTHKDYLQGMMRDMLLVERGKLLEVLGHLGSIETPYKYLQNVLK